MTNQPIELMFGAYRRKLLAVLLMRPEEDFHVRELGRMAGIPAGSLHRELRALAAAGLLVSRRQGNQVRYRANRSCPIFEELAGIFRKTIGLSGVIRDALQEWSEMIELAFVFGSVAAGREHVSSDVDLLIIGDISLVDAVNALAPIHERLGREINPVVMTTAEFISQQETGGRFASCVISEPKIFVLGNEDDLAQLAGHGAAG